jgi:YHS domain-containing protein
MRTIIIFFMFFLGAYNSINAQTSLRTKHFNTEKSLAVNGYDVVAYFQQNKAIKGSAKYTAIVEGISYYFSNESNKQVFLKNPKQYEPQYGGWCAYAMGATGEKVEVDPETFKIVQGKLYLFYHSWVNNTLTKWNKDEVNLKNNADKHWQQIFH